MRWISIAGFAVLLCCHTGAVAWAGDRRHDDWWFWNQMQQQEQEQQQRRTDWQNAQQREFDRMDAENRHQQIMRNLEAIERKR